MAKLVALTLLAAVAAQAQNAELVSGSDGGLLVSRRQTTSVSDIDVRIERAVGEARTAAATAAYNATLEATMAMTNQMAALQTSVAAQMAAATAANEAAASRIAVQMSEMQSTSVAQSDAAAVAAAAAGAVLTAQIEDLSTAVTASLANNLARSDATLATTVAAINVNLTRVLTSVPPVVHHSWHGGCSGEKNGGWHWVCLDRVKHDSAAPYFRKSSNERFSSLRPGMFQFISFSICRSSSWIYHNLVLNGGSVYHTHGMSHGRHRGGWWTDTHQDGMMKVPSSGWWWGMRVHSNSWQSWHGEGHHSRIETHYLGKIE